MAAVFGAVSLSEGFKIASGIGRMTILTIITPTIITLTPILPRKQPLGRHRRKTGITATIRAAIILM